jgi:hypothetical protein
MIARVDAAYYARDESSDACPLRITCPYLYKADVQEYPAEWSKAFYLTTPPPCDELRRRVLYAFEQGNAWLLTPYYDAGDIAGSLREAKTWLFAAKSALINEPGSCQ